MALPSSGSISMSQVRAELKLSGSINLGHSRVRGLAGRPSGSISMSQLRGKSDKKWVHIKKYEGAIGGDWGNPLTAASRFLTTLRDNYGFGAIDPRKFIATNNTTYMSPNGEYKLIVHNVDTIKTPREYILNLYADLYHLQ